MVAPCEGLNLDEEDIEVTAYAIDRAEMAMNDDQERGLREEDAIEADRRLAASLRRTTQIERQAVSTCLEHLGWSAQALRPSHSAAIPLPPDAKWERPAPINQCNLKQGNSIAR